MSLSPPVFGKRGAARMHPDAALPVGALTSVSETHAEFFAAVRAEMADGRDDRRTVVPRSFKAAFLAGLVVGCALAGFDVTAAGSPVASSPLAMIAGALGTPIDTSPLDLTPVKILLGLFGGARMAATTILVVQSLLNWADLSSRAAYAAGGAMVSAALAAVMFVAMGHPPAHGWIIELVAGAACGLLYRVFAGSRPAAKS